MKVLFWRRLDTQGLERMELRQEGDGVTAHAALVCLDEGGLRIEHRWRLDAQWRAQETVVERWGPQGHGVLRLERSGSGWRVDGAPRPDLDGAEEADLSVTPFCNTLAIRRTPAEPGASLTLDTAYIDGAALTVTRSRQRYERLGPKRVRYVDLGVASGFEAELQVDDEGLVLHYEQLFERVVPA